MPLFKESLQDRLLRHLDAASSMPEGEILRIFAGVLEGVAQLHAKGWAHRDIKPANILLSAEGSPVLMDFGSTKPAKVIISSRTEALLLMEDAAQHCSMAYRAPELWDCPSRDAVIDERIDVWSLGVRRPHEPCPRSSPRDLALVAPFRC